MKNLFLILFFCFAFIASVFAQNITVTGLIPLFKGQQ